MRTHLLFVLVAATIVFGVAETAETVVPEEVFFDDSSITSTHTRETQNEDLMERRGREDRPPVKMKLAPDESSTDMVSSRVKQGSESKENAQAGWGARRRRRRRRRRRVAVAVRRRRRRRAPRGSVLKLNSVIGLRGGRSNKWCSDEINRVLCNRPWIKAFEKFTVVNGGGGTVGLKGGRSHKYCSDEINAIKCNRPWVKGWEKFTAVRVGNRIGLKGGHGHKYCSDSGGGVCCNRPWIKGWEKFLVHYVRNPTAKKKAVPKSNGKSTLKRTWNNVKLRAKNGVPARKYSFKEMYYTGKSGNDYTGMSIRGCKQNGAGWKPVCAHPSYCRNDHRSLYIGQTQFLSYGPQWTNTYLPAGLLRYKTGFRIDHMCFYTGGSGGNYQDLCAWGNSHAWKRPNLARNYLCGKSLGPLKHKKRKKPKGRNQSSLKRTWRHVKLGPKNGVPASTYTFKEMHYNGHNNGDYSGMSVKGCRQNGAGYKPVCNHPSYCRNDHRSIYIGQTHHLSYGPHWNNAYLPAGLYRYKTGFRLDHMCTYTGASGGNYRDLCAWGNSHTWKRPTAARNYLCAKKMGAWNPAFVNGGKQCWNTCHKKQGKCSWCGTTGYCCRKGLNGNGCTGATGVNGRYTCVMPPRHKTPAKKPARKPARKPVRHAQKAGAFKVYNKPVANFAVWATTVSAKLVSADFNGDGKADAALVGGRGWRTIPVAFATKTRGSYRVTNRPVTSMPQWAATPGAKCVTGDFNGDRKGDIACIGPRGWATFPTAMGNGDGSFTVHNMRIANFASWATTAGVKLVSGDFNGDGKTDAALVGGAGWRTIPVAFSNGNGSYRVTNYGVPSFPQWAASPGAQCVAGDFNGDKKADIACEGPRGWATFPIAFGKGNGQFRVTNRPIANFASWATTPSAKLVSADFNGDGKDDAALVGGRGWRTIPVAFSNGGSGTFHVTNHPVTNFPQWAAQAGAQVVAGDFDGDKKADIACEGPRGWGTFPTAYGQKPPTPGKKKKKKVVKKSPPPPPPKKAPPKHIGAPPKHHPKRHPGKGKGKRRNPGCPPMQGGAVHCGKPFHTTCINDNMPMNSLSAAYRQCGKVKGCTRIMHWGKDGKWYLRTSKDKVVKGEKGVHYRNYQPHKYTCHRL